MWSTNLTVILVASAGALAAADIINQGPDASSVPSDTWNLVVDHPNATSSNKFTGFGLSSAYPSKPQDGWTLTASTRGGLDISSSENNGTGTIMRISAPSGGARDVDDSWLICLHVLTVNAASATDGSTPWGSGETPSCNNLVQSQCIDHLQGQAADAFGQGCPSFTTEPACLRDLVRQHSVTLAVSASDAESLFTNGTFYHRIDGDGSTFSTASAQPMAVIAAFGKQGVKLNQNMTAVTCVMPDAKPVKTGASPGRTTGFVGWVALSAAVATFLW